MAVWKTIKRWLKLWDPYNNCGLTAGSSKACHTCFSCSPFSSSLCFHQQVHIFFPSTFSLFETCHCFLIINLGYNSNRNTKQTLGERVSLAFGGIDGLSELEMLLFLAFRVQLENLKFQEKSQKNLYS
jgi:hypothetical protein